jgi:hypothetical protein
MEETRGYAYAVELYCETPSSGRELCALHGPEGRAERASGAPAHLGEIFLAPIPPPADDAVGGE